MTTLVAILEDTLARCRDAPALLQEGVIVSYGDLDRLSRRVATGLAGQGIEAGDRLALWLPNRVEWLVAFLAACRLGAVVVAVNPRYRAAELEDLLGRSAAKLLITRRQFGPVAVADVLAGIDPRAVPELQSVILVDDSADPATDEWLGRPLVAWSTLTAADGPPPEAARPDAPCIVFTTSGTTRGPKLVLHRQDSLASHAGDIAGRFGLAAPGARLLCFLPFCGVFGLVGVLGGLAAGSPVVVLDSFDASEAVRLAREQAITHCFGSDEMYERMLACAGEATPPFPQARCFGFASFHHGGLAFAKQAAQRGLPLLGLYGSSEVLALFAAQDHALPIEERLRAGGRPIAGGLAAVRVRDPVSGDLVPPGVSGELEVRTPRLFAGYLGDPEATAAAMTADGFFRTGDLAHLREDGSFVFEARMGDSLRLSGFLVNPGDIEAVLKEAPGVSEAQVVGVDIRGSLRPVAFAVAAAGQTVSPEAVQAHCRGRMARYKVPARVWMVDGFPLAVGPNGSKIQRTRLREMAAERLAEEDTE
jgi:fatty-acyl-CoA synthase